MNIFKRISNFLFAKPASLRAAPGILRTPLLPGNENPASYNRSSGKQRLTGQNSRDRAMRHVVEKKLSRPAATVESAVKSVRPPERKPAAAASLKNQNIRSRQAGRTPAPIESAEAARTRTEALDAYIFDETIYPLKGGGWGNIRGRLSVDPFAGTEVTATLPKAVMPVAENAMVRLPVNAVAQKQADTWVPVAKPVAGRRARSVSVQPGPTAKKTSGTPKSSQTRLTPEELDAYIIDETIYPLAGGGWGNIRGRLSVNPYPEIVAATTVANTVSPVEASQMKPANAAPQGRSQPRREKKWSPSLTSIPERPLPDVEISRISRRRR